MSRSQPKRHLNFSNIYLAESHVLKKYFDLLTPVYCHTDNSSISNNVSATESVTDDTSTKKIEFNLDWWHQLDKEWKIIFKKSLNIDHDPSMNELNKIYHIKTLNIHGSVVKNLDPIKNLKNLKILNCSFTQISNLNPLQYLVNLKELNCMGTIIKSLEPIKNLSTLEYINCNVTRIKKKEIRIFRKEHPNCIIE